MKRILLGSVLALTLAAFCWSASSTASAQELKQGLPSVESILDREAEAMGGKEANSKVKTFIMRATASVEGVDIQLIVHYAGPNKQCMEVVIDGIGSEMTVINGDTAWVTDSLSGDRILQGEEKEHAFREAKKLAETYQGVGNWRTLYKQVSLLGEVDLDGKTAYKVSLTNQKGEVLIDYYDNTTGLLLQRETTINLPDGPVEAVFSFSDYRKVDGITHAFITTIAVYEGNIVVTLDSMQLNVAIPESLFVLPPDLKNGGGN